MYKRLLYVIAGLLFTGMVHAGPVHDLIADAGNAGDYAGAGLVTLFDSTAVQMQESGLSYYHTHKLVKVLTADGAQDMRVIKYGYDPLSAWVEIQKVVVYKQDGTQYEVKAEVLDYPAPARMIYWGAREKMLEVGRLEPGDAVEVFLFKKGYTYALLGGQDDEEKYIPPMRGHYYDIVEFWSEEPVLEKVYTLRVPQSKTVQYEFFNGEVRSRIYFDNGHTVYQFSKRDIMPLSHERGMVAMSDVASKLLISTSPDWEAKSLWFYGVNEDYGSFESTPEVDAMVAKIVKGAKNEMDSVSRLTHWVADNMRYSGISMGPGEGYTLHNAAMNFRDRCGVCKDKASLLIAMLRAAGFKSYPAMTMAGSRIDDVPADQFNHSVTVVKLSDGKYHLLDPTWVPFVRELWSSAEQQQNYLMGVPEGADLGITPVSAPEKHYVNLKNKCRLSKNGTLTGSFTIQAEGQSDAAIRRMFTSGFMSSWKQSVERELLVVAPAAKVTSVNYGKDPYRYMDGPITITVKYVIPEFAVVTDDEIILKSLVAKGLFKRAQAHMYAFTGIEERSYGFRDRCSREVNLHDEIHLPVNAQVMYKPEAEASSGSGASFDGGYQLKGRKLLFDLNSVFNKRVYEAEDWASYRAAVLAQKKMATEPVILNIK